MFWNNNITDVCVRCFFCIFCTFQCCFSVLLNFALTTVKAVFPYFRMTNENKLMCTVNRNMDAIMKFHQLIWPGEEVHLRKPKFARGEGGLHQNYWFRETTVPTSWYVAFIGFSLNNKHRTKIDRAHAATAFKHTCISICAGLNGMSLKHIQFGSDQRTTLAIGMNGVIDSALQVWTEAFYVRFVRKHWEGDFTDDTKPWITSPSGLTNVAFAELVVFCLDPQHPKQLNELLVECAWSLLSQFALLLDENVVVFQRQVEDINSLGHAGVKNRKRHATIVKTVWVELAARKIWKGEDPGSNNGMFLFDNLIWLICLCSKQGTP